LVIFLFVFFFFSSRRRHTRSDRDWSSDVCSSDLLERIEHGLLCFELFSGVIGGFDREPDSPISLVDFDDPRRDILADLEDVLDRSEERRVGKECRSWGWTSD